uniref:Pilus assembly protein n=1 Tax=Ascaris lumbricoides TaxID=6252 RepID=A0A0M3HLE7_ASCLU
MSGNEDRAGLSELIQMIRETRIPIICICNDRQSPKMRSLVNYCFDVRFQRPRVEQIRVCDLMSDISSYRTPQMEELSIT